MAVPTMLGFKPKFRLAALVIVSIGIGLAGLYDLLKPITNGCVMTYMYPTYIPISALENVSSAKYGLYKYHEGWKKIDFEDHLKRLNGVPVLFIPGNGGSYKQVRSIAAESDRAYQGGPRERMLYQEASLTYEDGINMVAVDVPMPTRYTRMLDWFAVDLEGEHSAMDGQILEEHTEYVVHAIHRILDHYRKSFDALAKEGDVLSGSVPRSVILVGHSMGGFVARAVLVHPHLRKSAVETILTLSAPHQSPPLALQPSLGHYYKHINEQWRKGYVIPMSRDGNRLSAPQLSNVVVVSISGGIHDYQVRSKLETLDGIVPPSHGFMISSTGMKNVWLSMEHQVILWCNQVVVQVSHTLLSLVDSETGHPFSDTRKRVAMFTQMLHSRMPEAWLRQLQLLRLPPHVPLSNPKDILGSQVKRASICPEKARWSEDEFEKDLYIKTSTMTILAMDGRRRWLDIRTLGSNGRKHFIFVTNLIPCYGVRLHLWPEKGNSSSGLHASRKVVEVTSKMAQIPSGPAPRQAEPGSQTEQASPSAVFWLDPKDMHGFRFLTISVAPSPKFITLNLEIGKFSETNKTRKVRLLFWEQSVNYHMPPQVAHVANGDHTFLVEAVSGKPPPASSMAVGQFFNPEEGSKEFTRLSLLLSIYSHKDMLLMEDHPLALHLSFDISLGLLPVKLSLETTGCGIKKSGLPDEDVGDLDNTRLCKLRCFPPVALAWDPTSGLHIFPNLHSNKILVDSSPALWNSDEGSEKTTILLLVDPHCSYRTRVTIPFTAAASRFLLLYCSQIIGFSFAVVFFALMRQANAWELDLPIPSVLSAVESNLRLPLPFLFLVISPILIALFYSCLGLQPFPPLTSFVVVSMICYLISNGAIIVVVLISQMIFYMAASVHVFTKTRWRWDWFVDLSTSFLSFKVLRIVRNYPSLVSAMPAVALVCFVHPALGMFLLLSSYAFCCHDALSSFLTASYRGHTRTEDLFGFESDTMPNIKYGDEISGNLLVDENSSTTPDSARSYGDTQLEIFHHRHGLLILHLLATLMFVPSLVAWIQRISTGQSFPWVLDSALCIGVILHAVCVSKPEFNFFFHLEGIPKLELRAGFAYLLAGYCCYLSGLALAPYIAFYGMASIGVVSLAYRIIERRYRERGETYYSTRKHSHRH